MGVNKYTWRSRDDSKVRDAHARHDDQVFDWQHPPPGGHPGMEFNCRCTAEPVLDDLGDAVIKDEDPQQLATYGLAVALTALAMLNPVTTAAARALMPAVLDMASAAVNIARGAAARAGISGFAVARQLRQVHARIVSIRNEHIGLFKRPAGVPKDWIREPSNKGDGVKYIDPLSKRDSYVRITRGKPQATFEGQRVDYVRWQKKSRSLDKDGNFIDKNTLESHIPVKEFTFRPELFK